MREALYLREQELLERLRWFIKIRWATVVFIIAAVQAATHLFNVSLPILPIYLIVLFIAGYNSAFKFYVNRVKPASFPWEHARRFALAQSMMDILCLTVLIHLTGGSENPFIFYFIFHTILAGMLLNKMDSYIQSGIVSCLVVGLFILEYSGILQHHPVAGFISAELYNNPTYLFSVSFVFISTIFIASFFTVSVSEKLGLKEKELEAANIRLMEKDRLKDEYVTMVSHDLKSPLSSIQSLLEVILGGLTGPVDEKTRELLERIQGKTEFLHHYVKDLLDLSRIRSEMHLKLQRFNIKDVIDAAVEVTLPKMDNKRIEFTIEIEENLPEINADREQMVYVFINLVANAFKYTPPGGKVWIKASHENSSVLIEVGDTGIGIPNKEVPLIFDEFFRASNVAKTTGGTGLGLTLAKHIIERHGGAISAESTLGKGSVFRIVLPADATQMENVKHH